MPSSTTPSKPLPTRNPSTRIQEPPSAKSQLRPSPSTKSQLHPSPSTKKRPPLSHRRTTAQTRYITMLLELDQIPKSHNLLAAAFVWILLAGYIVFPTTFNRLQNKDSDNRVLQRVKNVPLLYIASFACGIGVAGSLWLWWRWRSNYVWVINRIFLPALMNSLAGLVGTIGNIYSAQDGQYSVTAKVTIIVTATCTFCAAALFLIYNCVMLAIVKRRHERETDAVDRDGGSVQSPGGEKVSGRLGALGKDSGRLV